MNLRLLHDRILVKPDEKKKESEGGILIPDSVQERPNVGTIISVGPGTKDQKMSAEVGNKIMFGKHAGIDMNIDGEDVVFIRESDIIAIL